MNVFCSMSCLMRTYKPQIMFKATKPQNIMFLEYSFCFFKCLHGVNNPFLPCLNINPRNIFVSFLLVLNNSLRFLIDSMISLSSNFHISLCSSFFHAYFLFIFYFCSPFIFLNLYLHQSSPFCFYFLQTF